MEPNIPVLAFKRIWLMTLLSFKNSSLCTFHPKPTDQKGANLLLDPNAEDPSTLNVASKRYLFL